MIPIIPTRFCFWYLALAGMLAVASVAAADSLLGDEKRKRLLEPPSADLDTTTVRRGETFVVSYAPETRDGKVRFAKMHSWTLTVKDAHGGSVPNALVTVTGEMPQHMHGLASAPRVKEIGEGRYAVTGLKFHMPGWWRMTISVRRDGDAEALTFDLLL